MELNKRGGLQKLERVLQQRLNFRFQFIVKTILIPVAQNIVSAFCGCLVNTRERFLIKYRSKTIETSTKKKRVCLEDQGADGKMIYKWI